MFPTVYFRVWYDQISVHDLVGELVDWEDQNQAVAVLEPIHCVYLSLYSSLFGDSPALLSLLQSVQASGCEALFCHGTRHMIVKSTVNDRHTTLICPSNIQVLHIEFPLLFVPTCISFTLAALHSAPLRDLAFTNTSLTHNQWSTLLRRLTLPHLSVLKINDTCPISSLVGFLHRHRVEHLRFCCHTACSLDLVKRRRSRIPLRSLSTLDASPAMITSLMCFVDIPLTFKHLVVRPNQVPDKHGLLSTLLACTEPFADLSELQVNIPGDVDDLLAYAMNNDLRTCSAKEVFLAVSPPLGNPDAIVSHHTLLSSLFEVVFKTRCAPWL